MNFKKLHSDRVANVNLSKYMVVWDGPCRSKFQKEVKQWLKPYWRGHLCVEELRIPGSRMTCDLVNITKKVIVETSGDQHLDFNPHFHLKNRANWLGQIKRDGKKKEWAAENGFLLVEIFPDDMPLRLEFFQEKYGIDIR